MPDSEPKSHPLIPDAVLDAYPGRFPHLRRLGGPGRTGRQAALTFARNACRLEAPVGIGAAEPWRLARVAGGAPWPDAA